MHKIAKKLSVIFNIKLQFLSDFAYYISIVFLFPLTHGIIQKLLLIFVGIIALLRSSETIIKIRETPIFRNLLIISFLNLMWIILESFAHFSGYQRILQLLIFYFILFDSSTRKWKQIEINQIAYLYIISLVSWYIALPFSISNNYKAYYENSNGFGLICFLAFFFVFLSTIEKRKKRVLLVLIVIMTFISGSRANIMGIVILFFSYKFLSKNKDSYQRRAKVMFWLVIVAIMTFTVIYPSLYTTSLGTNLNLISRRYFHKNFFSGRQIHWSGLLEYIYINPLYGYGNDVNSKSFISEGVGSSAHNLYLQTTIQSGIIGFILLIFFIYTIYKIILRQRDVRCIKTVCLILAVLWRETFEVSLTQNNWHYSTMTWLVFGVALSISRYDIYDMTYQSTESEE